MARRLIEKTPFKTCKCVTPRQQVGLFDDVDDILRLNRAIAGVERELREHLVEVRRILQDDSIREYKTLLQDEYLIEVKRGGSSLKRVPTNWITHNETKVGL